MPQPTPSRATVALTAEADALDTLARTLDARADVVRASIEELSGDDDHPAHAVARAHLGGIVVGYTMAAVEARRRAVEARSTAAVEAQMPDDDHPEQPEPMTVRTLEALLDWLDAGRPMRPYQDVHHGAYYCGAVCAEASEHGANQTDPPEQRAWCLICRAEIPPAPNPAVVVERSGTYQHAPAGSTDALADALAVLRPDCGCPYPRCPSCAE